MITYEVLLEACKRYGLDSTIVGTFKRINGHPLDTYDEPIDLNMIDFPEKELIQVVEIGKMIYNLKSQLVFRCYNLGTESGKMEHERDTYIKSILPTMEDAIDFWLKSGLKKSKECKDLIIHNGRVFEINPVYQKSIEEMNKRLAEYHRDFIIKQANSEREAENIILC